MAYWILVDDSLQNKGLHFYTYAFTIEEVLIKKTLENLFGDNSVKCSKLNLSKRKRTYIWEKSMKVIRNNISHFMFEDMP